MPTPTSIDGRGMMVWVVECTVASVTAPNITLEYTSAAAKTVVTPLEISKSKSGAGFLLFWVCTLGVQCTYCESLWIKRQLNEMLCVQEDID